MLAVLGGLTVFYLTRVLLFEEKDSHFGPWPSKTRRVVWFKFPPEAVFDDPEAHAYEEYRQPVTLFDWVRRVFGLYRVAKYGDEGQKTAEELWYVNSDRVEVWTCPVCLSFWTALFTTAFLVGYLRSIEALIFLLPMAAISVLMHSLRDFLERGVNVYISVNSEELS